jgi:uncharacterized protein (DUF3820 family)
MNDTKAIIEAFCERLGIKSGADAEGVYSFSVDAGEFAIHDLPEEGLLLVTADLGHVPPGDAGNLFRLMLEAQHNFRATAGATFSIDGERDCFTLARVIPSATLDEDVLFREVERFVNLFEAWTHIIRNYEGHKEVNEKPIDLYGIKV